MPRYYVHPANPQAHILHKICALLQQGNIIVFPSETGYEFLCTLGNKAAVAQIRMMRDLDKHHLFTLFCRDLGHVSDFADVGKEQYRVLRSCYPGPYTFILRATRQVPKLLLHPKRKTIGIRISAYMPIHALLELLGEALMGVSVYHRPHDRWGEVDTLVIAEAFENRVAAFVEIADVPHTQTTVIDYTQGVADCVRQGAGRWE